MPRYQRRPLPFHLYEIDLLGASDQDLLDISEDRQLALSLSEMQRMREHYQKLGRNPTDVEVEALAQAWSEHSCYKSSWPVLEKNIFTIQAPQNLLVIVEDSGVVTFDDEYAYVVALESHNHPSALDPVGGAETGIGGILRDVLCMGAQPIALVDPLFFGPLDYPASELPAGIKHPTFLFKGVVDGIRDYGNRVGIPTVAGMVHFDPGYVGNCLVNVGCVGIVKRDRIIRSRAEEVGSVFILVGGRTGRDGIHGVSSLASTELTARSEDEARAAVQMGDAIMKEPVMHACLEAIDRGLVLGLKDCGGGGLSSSVGEMAYAGGNGCEVDLDKVPLKAADMTPWEIWVSESQERMMLSVAPDKVEEALEVFLGWDVPATAIGRTTDTKRTVLRYKGEVVADLDLAFYTGALRYQRPRELRPVPDVQVTAPVPHDLTAALVNLLSSPNLCSREWIVRQYDHEVRGNTVLKPLQGEIWHPGHGDAAVIKPLEHSWKGLALATDVNPAFMRLDPYWGAASAVCEAVCNVAAVGARPHSWADNLNFGNPEKPDRMGDFVRATDGLHLVAKELGLPCVSGNVSFYNEAPTGSVPPTPTIFCIGIVEDVRRCVTSDLKEAGNLLYVVGATGQEMGGAAYSQLILGQEEAGRVPQVDVALLRSTVEALVGAIEAGLVRACHDVSQGGLAVALAEMTFGSTCGAEADLTPLCTAISREDFALFSESNGRFILEVQPDKEAQFLEAMREVPVARMGSVLSEPTFRIRCGSLKMEAPVETLRTAWQKGLAPYVGE